MKREKASMVVVGEVFSETQAKVGTKEVVYGGHVKPPPQEEIDRRAREVGERLGLLWQPEPANGEFLKVIEPDGSALEMERNPLFGFGTSEESLDVITAMVERIHERFGPGRVWTLNGLYVATDGGRPGDGPPIIERGESGDHLRFYCWFCHEKAPRNA